ncbi:MAG: hypothetical protein MUP33_11835, partial [Polaromonas sp.]|nr:hypothetical protein [Polaromonas sp.]
MAGLFSWSIIEVWIDVDVNVNVNFIRLCFSVFPTLTLKEHPMDIAGKVFIVTGGASGLGEGTARMLVA